jgi:hypothetical protein
MLTICIGRSRQRLRLQCTRFYTQGELFKMTREQGKNSSIWFEYGPNLYQPINNDYELRFVCQIIEGDIDSYMPDEDREHNKRDLEDIAHTHAFDARVRKQRGTHSRNKRTSVSDTPQYTTEPTTTVQCRDP